MEINNNKNIKCNGYESMFTFLSDEDFQQHLKVCDKCRAEHERMQRVSALIQEAKPYIKRTKKNNMLKIACILTIVLFSSLSIPLLIGAGKLYDDYMAYNSPTIEEMGLPVDEYGFLLVE